MMKTCLSRLLLAALLGLAASQAAQAGDDAYALARQGFDRHVAAAAAEKRLPRMTEPAFGAIMKTLTDQQRFLGNKRFSAEQLEPLMEMCNASNRAAMSYALFGQSAVSATTVSDPRALEPLNSLIARNTVTYQDELILLLAFNMQCIGKALPLLNAAVAQLKPEQLDEQRRRGIREIRAGARKMLLGGAQTIADRGIRKDNQRRMAVVTGANAPLYAGALTLASRKQVNEYLHSIAPQVPQECATEFLTVLKAASSTDCSGLCAVPVTD